jgi:hypothetical protein
MRPLAIVAGVLALAAVEPGPGGFERTRFELRRFERQQALSNLMRPRDAAGPSLQLLFERRGIDALPRRMRVNNKETTSLLRCDAKNAAGTDWECSGIDADTLTKSGSPTLDQEIPSAGAADRSVYFDGASSFAASSGLIAQIATEDIAIEFFGEYAAAIALMASTRTGSGSPGYDVVHMSSDQFRLTIDQGGGSVACDSGASSASVGSIYNGLVFVNRDENSANGCQWYLNGDASGTGANMSTAAATLDNGDTFTLGSRTGGVASWMTGRLAHFEIWALDDWFAAGASGPAQWAVVAAEREAMLTGTYPDVAWGDPLPSTATRDSLQTVWKNGARFTVGPHLLNTIGGEYYPLGAIENLILDATDFSGAWTCSGCTTVTTSGNGSPSSIHDTGDGAVGTAVDGAKFLQQLFTPVAGKPLTVSVSAKPGTHPWAAIYVLGLAAGAYIDITNCDGTQNNFGAAPLTVFAIPQASGWCWIGTSFADGTAATGVRFYACDGDGDCTVTGDAVSDMVYFDSAQVEEGDRPTPLCESGAVSTCTREPDVLEFVANTGNDADGATGQGTFTITYRSIAPLDAQLDLALVQKWGTVGVVQSQTTFVRNTNLPRARLWNVANDGIADGTTDVLDGATHTTTFTWTLNDLRIYNGTTQEAQDTSVNPSTVIETIGIGSSASGTAQFNGYIDEVTIYPRVRAP